MLSTVEPSKWALKSLFSPSHPYFYIVEFNPYLMALPCFRSTVASTTSSPGVAARTLACVADVLGAMAGERAGLRSGPARNESWMHAFDLLYVSALYYLHLPHILADVLIMFFFSFGEIVSERRNSCRSKSPCLRTFKMARQVITNSPHCSA